MKRIVQILFLIFLYSNLISQIESKDLNGKWTVSSYNGDNYVTSDTIKLLKTDDLIPTHLGSKTIFWDKSNKRIRINYISDPEDISNHENFYEKGRFKLKSKKRCQIITIVNGCKVLESFEIIKIEKTINKDFESEIYIEVNRIENNRSKNNTHRYFYNPPPTWFLGYMFQFF